jgi:hypothetical protein
MNSLQFFHCLLCFLDRIQPWLISKNRPTLDLVVSANFCIVFSAFLVKLTLHFGQNFTQLLISCISALLAHDFFPERPFLLYALTLCIFFTSGAFPSPLAFVVLNLFFLLRKIFVFPDLAFLFYSVSTLPKICVCPDLAFCFKMFLHNKGIMLPRLGIFVLNCSYTT